MARLVPGPFQCLHARLPCVGSCSERRHPVSAVFKAVFGVNKFLVTYPQELQRQYPQHVTSTTVYGRLASKDTIVNVNVALEHDSKVCTCLSPSVLHWPE
jgi:hypothetical protein